MPALCGVVAGAGATGCAGAVTLLELCVCVVLPLFHQPRSIADDEAAAISPTAAVIAHTRGFIWNCFMASLLFLQKYAAPHRLPLDMECDDEVSISAELGQG